jgi:hypothetical protein
MRLDVAVREDLIYPPPRGRVIQFVGPNNRGKISQTAMAAERPGKYKARRKKKKK